MPELAAFHNIYAGKTIVVCGCGESLNEFACPKRFITIGVNDVERRFTPDYLVVVNPREQFSGDRFRYVENSRAKFLFTHLNLGLARPNIVKFRLGAFGGVEFGDCGVLHYTHNSPYVALCLAAQMGAARIGLIGVDFTPDHFFARTGTHPLAPRMEAIDAQYRALNAALRARGVEVVNLSRASRLTAFPKRDMAAFAASAEGAGSELKPLRIVSYATTPVVGVPSLLAHCLRTETPHAARCVWARNDYGNGLTFAAVTESSGQASKADDAESADITWTEQPEAARAALADADLVIAHNGKIEAAHRPLLAGKAVVTLAHNSLRNVDGAFVAQGFPGAVIGQGQAATPEFAGWDIVPNPVPIEMELFRPAPKNAEITLCYTPAVRHERYPVHHPLYWHAKGYESTLRILDKLAARHPIRLEAARERNFSHAEAMARKRRAHIVIDECATGSYHRNSLEGMALGSVVVNGLGIIPAVADVFRRCAGTDGPLPFVFATLDTLEDALESLIALGADALTAQGTENRLWMERRWRFAPQFDRFWRPVFEKALEKGTRKREKERREEGKERNAEESHNPKSNIQHGVAENKAIQNPKSKIQSSDVPKSKVHNGVSVIIPQGGRDRLPHLAATLANLRDCAGVAEIIVVELDEGPFARDAARRLADKYVFSYSIGLFHKSRALNIGIPFAASERLLWLDNDLLLTQDFIPKALAEMESRRLDCLIPWTQVDYLSEADTGAVLAGGRAAAACRPVNRFYSRNGTCGAAVLARTSFVRQNGGFCEEFRGWGGEDNAWFYKAQILGRAAVTGLLDQRLLHLFHALSGGYGTRDHLDSNPHYQRNADLLREMRTLRDAASLRRRFPLPAHYSCPWPAEKRIVCLHDAADANQRAMAREVARAFFALYGLSVGVAQDAAGGANDADARIFFGTNFAAQSLAQDGGKAGRTLIAHDADAEPDSGEESERPFSPDAARFWRWQNMGGADSFTLALTLAQPLSLLCAAGGLAADSAPVFEIFRR